MPARRLHLHCILLIGLSSLAVNCSSGGHAGPSCNEGDRCASDAECCEGLVCRLPSEGILPVAQERQCRIPVQGL